MKNILGLDPGNCTGYALVNALGDLIIYGEINIKKEEKQMAFLFSAINDLLRSLKPDLCVIEAIFVNPLNGKTTLRLCELRGVLVTCCELNHIPYISYAPTVIKKVICGRGNAKKSEIKKKFNISSHNICDAIAIAKTYTILNPIKP